MNAALLPAQKDIPTTTGHPKNGFCRSQVVHLQNLLIQRTLNCDLTNKELADLTRAWCAANEERRKLAMRPLPRSVDVDKGKRRHRSSQAADPQPAEPATVE